MPGNFEFLSEKFPELAEDGRKAEKYLYTDNEVCMFFISRIFDNAVKYICSFNDVVTDGTKLAEPINELFQKKAVDESIYLLLEMMRTFRNGNAHNKDYSLNDSMILLQMSHILCEWLMTKYGQTGYQRKGFIMPAKEFFSPGEIVECTVQTVMIFGVLVSFGAMSGMLHRTEIPSGSTDGYSTGDKITAKILSVNTAQSYAVLSIKQLFTEQPPIPAQPAVQTASAQKTQQTEPAKETAQTPQPTGAILTAEQIFITQPPAPKPQPAPQAKTQSPAMPDEDFLNLCAEGTLQTIQASIKNGANVNAVNSKGRTALMTAVMQNTHPEVIELLIDSGSDINAKSKTGINALGYAPHNKHMKGTKALERLKQLTQI